MKKNPKNNNKKTANEKKKKQKKINDIWSYIHKRSKV